MLVPPTVEIREDIAAELPRFRAIREKHGVAVPDDEEHLRALTAEGRVLLAITPDQPPSGWTCWGLISESRGWQNGAALACPDRAAIHSCRRPC